MIPTKLFSYTIGIRFRILMHSRLDLVQTVPVEVWHIKGYTRSSVHCED